MTEKEKLALAENYAIKFGNENILHFGEYLINLEFIRRYSFLDGLEAGRPKWHKVADGDYPPCEKGNYTINILTDCGDIAYYDYNEYCWIAEPSSVEIDPPIAWCEIPKYTEE